MEPLLLEVKDIDKFKTDYKNVSVHTVIPSKSTNTYIITIRATKNIINVLKSTDDPNIVQTENNETCMLNKPYN